MYFHRTVLFSIVLALAGCSAADRGESTPGTAQTTSEPMSGVEISQVGAKLIFDGKATEVGMTITNRRSSPISFAGLRDDARLTAPGGSALRLHPISVGLAKPLVVPPKSSVTTSLLFEGDGTQGRTLELFKAKLPL